LTKCPDVLLVPRLKPVCLEPLVYLFSGEKLFAYPHRLFPFMIGLFERTLPCPCNGIPTLHEPGETMNVFIVSLG
jgi:hypothetical protein